jgi:hypothetical protein
VHGLNAQNREDTAHAWDTWRTPSGPTGRLWLRDDLPGQIPPCRIFIYEYNSAAVYGTSRATFIDKANDLLESVRMERVGVPRSRPIIFLGHTMGGLLIKQALINGKSNPRRQDIMDATYGLCFFATPHGGGERTRVRLRRSLANLAIKAGLKKGDNVIEALKPGGMFAETIAEQWRHQSGHYDCISFWGSLDEVSTFSRRYLDVFLMPLGCSKRACTDRASKRSGSRCHSESHSRQIVQVWRF